MPKTRITHNLGYLFEQPSEKMRSNQIQFDSIVNAFAAASHCKWPIQEINDQSKTKKLNPSAINNVHVA